MSSQAQDKDPPYWVQPNFLARWAANTHITVLVPTHGLPLAVNLLTGLFPLRKPIPRHLGDALTVRVFRILDEAIFLEIVEIWSSYTTGIVGSPDAGVGRIVRLCVHINIIREAPQAHFALAIWFYEQRSWCRS